MQTAAQRGLALVRFVIDRAVSRFTVQAFATGLLSAFGHNPTIAISNYDGEAQCVPETFEKAFVSVTVRTAAMDVLDEMKNDDRKKLEQVMYDQVLEPQRFPDAVYESTQITVQKLGDDLLVAHVTGELTFHGARRSHSFDARVMRLGT